MSASLSQMPKKITQQQNNKAQFRKFFLFYYLLPPVVLFVALCNLIFLHEQFLQSLKKNVLNNSPFFVSAVSYPVLGEQKNPFSFEKSAKAQELSLSAQAAVVMEDDSQVLLFSKNPTTVFPMASTTKIMTALTALQYFALQNVLTVQADGLEGSVVGFKKGEKISVENLLYGLLLPSGNDAAMTLSDNYPGGRLLFVEKMNENAKAYHLEQTHFEDAAGLSDKNQTSALDLARLSSVAIKNSTFARIVSTKAIEIKNADGSVSYQLTNLNKLLGLDGVMGVKTGFTEEAGEVLATAKVENGHRFILVVMKSTDRFSDTKRLLTLISGNVSFLTFEPVFYSP